MELREATEKDIIAIGSLFRDTILNVNSQHYTKEQVETWASGFNDVDKWKKRIAEQYFVLALEQDIICGFASITPTGYIDYMFVHKDHQKKGVAKSLLSKIFEKAKKTSCNRLTANVSITALPFFKSKGFKVMRVQKVLYKKVYFTNYHVEFFL